MTWEGLNPPYRTIVADPPWPMPETGKRTPAHSDTLGIHEAKGGRVVDGAWWATKTGKTVALPYSSLAVAEIAALPVSDVAYREAHLYLWTTNRFLESAFDVVREWGFRPGTVLTWCKPPMGLGFGGAFASTTEFIVTGRRGSLANTGRHDSTWLQASRPYRNGHIDHSAKPPAFLDLVESVSPGPYVELFARQPRLGWDSWGWGYEELSVIDEMGRKG